MKEALILLVAILGVVLAVFAFAGVLHRQEKVKMKRYRAQKLQKKFIERGT